MGYIKTEVWYTKKFIKVLIMGDKRWRFSRLRRLMEVSKNNNIIEIDRVI